MIVEADHYPRCVYAIDGGHNGIILGGLWFIHKNHSRIATKGGPSSLRAVIGSGFWLGNLWSGAKLCPG